MTRKMTRKTQGKAEITAALWGCHCAFIEDMTPAELICYAREDRQITNYGLQAWEDDLSYACKLRLADYREQ